MSLDGRETATVALRMLRGSCLRVSFGIDFCVDVVLYGTSCFYGLTDTRYD